MTKLDQAVTNPPAPRNGSREPPPERPLAEARAVGGESIEAMLAGLSMARSDRLDRATPIPTSGGKRSGRRAGGRNRTTRVSAPPAAKTRSFPTEAAIIDRYHRRDSSVEETLLEIYHAGVSMREAERIAEVLWGARVSLSTVCALNRKIADRIEDWRRQAIRGRHLYVFLSAVELKRTWGSDCRTVGVLVAIGVNPQGVREVLGVVEGDRNSQAAWLEFLRSLRKRGLTGVKLFVGDQLPPLAPSIAALYPGADYQHCVLQFYRRVLALVPLANLPAVEDLLKTIHSAADRRAARARAAQVVAALRAMQLPAVAAAVAEDVEQTLRYYAFVPAHWRDLRSNSLLNRIMREIRKRARAVDSFSDGQSAVFLVSARLRYIAATRWAKRYRMEMNGLHGLLDADARSGVAC